MRGSFLILRLGTTGCARLSNYSSEDLTSAMHAYELQKREETFVHLDYKMSRVGWNKGKRDRV
ncbi:hypothetical protein [Paenibacillus rhizophilus]|uniref:Beta galactosidase small chain/ domain-containing protein n=1 Tax=Paenibacillus rhizophilus TaxID=1850366 RepID=A0A3N9NYY1_9BACL|nr:hypothetical protein EH198_22755 [Paenibacillus rhizophilus]